MNSAVRTFRVGLTGGIASGKSTVADMFADCGAQVIDTDVVARDVVRPGEPALEEIRARFGNAVITASGKLNRRELRRRVFADDDARADLEAILHPRIHAEVQSIAATRTGDYQLVVVPLLVESELLQFVDRVLVVDCSEDTQIERLLRRDTETIEQARRILAAQSSREARLAIADDVISNNADLQHLQDRVKVLDRHYRQIASERGRHGRVPEIQ